MSPDCRRYQWLTEEARDRELTLAERSLLERHGNQCESCRQEYSRSAMALDLLRGARLEAEPIDPAFESRVLRRWRVESVRERVSYWSPALMGAALGLLAILATMQLLHQSDEPARFRPAEELSRSDALPAFPGDTPVESRQP